ncbi:hypothetical protein D3C81_1454280 [compost metagenome]
MHRADDLQRGHALVGDFHIDQMLRDHAGDFTASAQHAIGHRAHQASAAAAIHQAQAFVGDALAQFGSAFDIDGLGTGVGAAIDADGFHGFGAGIGGMGNRE